MSSHHRTLILGGGCFWCLEAVFTKIPGVVSVQSGYAGGEEVDPSYQEVCSGSTGHAEVVKIAYDSDVISVPELLNWFWKCHDPTTRDRQGADVGSQYRSIILYQNEAEKKMALESKSAAQANFTNPIVTEIEPLAEFYPAEAYHQNYFANNPNAPYCAFVIQPKLDKLGVEV